MNLFADVGKYVDNFRSFKVFVSGKIFKVLQNGTCNSDQSLFGPGEEPVHGATVDQSRVFSAPDSQRISDRTHGKNEMKPLSYSFDKGSVNHHGRLGSFEQRVKGSCGIDDILFFF